MSKKIVITIPPSSEELARWQYAETIRYGTNQIYQAIINKGIRFEALQNVVERLHNEWTGRAEERRSARISELLKDLGIKIDYAEPDGVGRYTLKAGNAFGVGKTLDEALVTFVTALLLMGK